MAYFYIIQHIRNKKYYVGVKLNGDSPKKLLTKSGYKTSSKIIKHIIKEEGINSFIIRKIKTFNDPKKAYEYETRFLKKCKCRTNENFYNQHENDNINFYKERHTTFLKYGVEYPFQSKNILQKTKNTLYERYGTTNPAKVNPDKIEKTMLDKYGVTNYFLSGMQHKKYKEKTGYNAPICDPVIKQQILKKRKIKSSRSGVELVKRYVKTYKIKLNKGWYQYDDDKLNDLITELQNLYGNTEILEINEKKVKKGGNKISQKQKSNRKIVNEVKEYFNNIGIPKVPFGRAWYMKSEEEIETMFNTYKEKNK